MRTQSIEWSLRFCVLKKERSDYAILGECLEKCVKNSFIEISVLQIPPIKFYHLHLPHVHLV